MRALLLFPLLLASVAHASFVDAAKHELNLKVIYAGTPDTAREAVVRRLYDLMKDQSRTTMRELNLPSGRMLTFDFAPSSISPIDGNTVRVHIYANFNGKPGTEGSWMRGADGIVYLADAAKKDESKNAFLTFGKVLGDLGAVTLPVTFMAEGAKDQASADALTAALGVGGARVVPSDSTKGVGVFEAIRFCLKGMIQQASAKTDASPKGPTREAVTAWANACKGGKNPSSCVDYGISLERGEGGLKADMAAARDAYLKGCNGGAYAGCGPAARAMMLAGGPNDLPAARAIAKKGCDQQDANSCRIMQMIPETTVTGKR